ITGSSRPWAGIDPKILNNSGHGIFSINAANPSVDLDVSKRILMRYGVNLLSKLKVAVVSLDLDILFSRYYEFPSFWNSIYRYTPGFVYDEAHDFWENGYPEGLLELTKNSYESNAEVRTEEWNRLGYKYTPSLGWEGNAVFADSTMLDTLPHLETVLTEPIKALIEEAEAKGIYLIGIIFPQAPGYNETGAFGRYGLRRSVAIQILEILRQFEKTYPHFRLMDENKMGYHDYDASMAMNFDHLSYLGAIQLSNRLDSLIQTLDINF
ncbi:MAG: TIGR02171 family protein, partial [Hallerella sp.]|nr:TIGR02171 family protein [Hallerella sp.]